MCIYRLYRVCMHKYTYTHNRDGIVCVLICHLSLYEWSWLSPTNDPDDVTYRLSNDPDYCSLFEDGTNLFVIKPPKTQNVQQVTIVPTLLENQSTKHVQYDPLNTSARLPIVDSDSSFILMDVVEFNQTNLTANISLISRARL